MLLSTSTPAPLSSFERNVFFESLSRLIDDFLIADQIVELWSGVAVALGCGEDVKVTQATFERAMRIEGAAADFTVFEVLDKKRSGAARSAAHLVFAEVLSRRLELLDCDYDRCGRRFILGKRTRFHRGECGRLFHARLTKRRNKQQYAKNFHRIDAAIGAIVVWLLNKNGDWRVAVLIAWSEGEGRKDLRIRMKSDSPQRSSRVPKEIGCRFLRKLIDAALDEGNSVLTQEVIKECYGDSADDKEYFKIRLSMLFGLIREAEATWKPRSEATDNTKVPEEDPALVNKLLKLAGL